MVQKNSHLVSARHMKDCSPWCGRMQTIYFIWHQQSIRGKVFSEAFPKSPQQIWQRIQLWHPELKQTWVGHWSLPSLWRYCTVRSWPFSGELALVDWSSSTCRAARGQTGWRQASREQEQMWDQSERILAKCHVRWCVLHYIIPLSTETGWSTCALLGGGE